MQRDIDRILGHITDIDTKKTIKSFADSLFVVMDKEIIYCTDFLTPGELKYCISLLNTYGFEDYIIYPSREECERNVIILHGNYNVPNPKEYIKILSFKTEGTKINHRDVLGAILSLGVMREKIGDILFKKIGPLFF
ncbi:YlmH/Sll1252 family protein [Lagierella sp.]|uniref:YlmH/Sll1252 family protein n=1 Tax=Lagierella sp. TaxID=2849657 RepID=UPI002625F6E8|nr:YlmH/Sll1252 family protein [Lagierella sp.]